MCFPRKKGGADALRKITMWILNDRRFQETGITNRAMLCVFLIESAITECSTQARLAEKMQLSRSQVNDYMKQFGKRFSFVSNSAYSQYQREC